MSELPLSSHELQIAVTRFNNAINHLENSISSAVSKVAELARNAGYEDGKLAAASELGNSNFDTQAAKEREESLEAAIFDARNALSEAIDDIRNIIGPV